MDKHDRGARWIFAVCLALFLIAVAGGINGSSSALWSAILRDPGTGGSLLLSTPKSVRSDEWLVWTPSLLSQASQTPPFPVENPALGAGKSTLLMNLPARDFSMLARPQLYGFFLLGAERGYAWYWNVKVFGLLAAMFFLLRKLLRGDTVLALCGSLWIFLSGFVQWWFSCPPMLPEMLASWALALGCIMSLVETQKPVARGFATLGLVIGALNFAFSMYPPFQIPLAYLGLVILAGWLWERRAKKQSPAPGRWNIACLLGAAALIAAAIVAYVLDCKPTLEMVAATSYPGARRILGGGLGFAGLFSGLAAPFMSEQHFPEKFSNICEAANFYPAWIIAAPAALWAFRKSRCENALPLGLIVYLLGFSAFCVCSLPGWFCRATLWSFVTEDRAVLGIGLANIFLSLIVLRRLRDAALSPRARIILALVAGGAAALFAGVAAHASPAFFSPAILSLSIALALLLAVVFLWTRAPVFCAAILCALAPAGLMVNPVMAGLDPLTQAAPLAAMRELRQADPQALWIAYDSSHLSAFLLSAGAPVLSGAKTLPDLAFYKVIDPTGASAGIYNRYSIVMFEMPEKRDEIRFELVNFCSHRIFIHPDNPALRAMNARYFVFKKPLDDPAAEGLELARGLPENDIWIYRSKR